MLLLLNISFTCASSVPVPYNDELLAIWYSGWATTSFYGANVETWEKLVMYSVREIANDIRSADFWDQMRCYFAHIISVLVYESQWNKERTPKSQQYTAFAMRFHQHEEFNMRNSVKKNFKKCFIVYFLHHPLLLCLYNKRKCKYRETEINLSYFKSTNKTNLILLFLPSIFLSTSLPVSLFHSLFVTLKLIVNIKPKNFHDNNDETIVHI